MTPADEVPMPEPEVLAAHRFHWPEEHKIVGYTADQLRAYADARCAQESAALISLLADIRAAAGDPTGKLDWPGLVEHVAKMQAERDALAEKVKAMEDELDHAKRVLSKTCQWPDCNCPQSMGTGHLHCERQPIHVIEPSKQGAAIDAAIGGDEA